MTPAQKSLYWREWSAVLRAKPDANRAQLTIEALGEPKSSKDFTNHDLDRVLGVFRAISHPASVGSQMRQIGQRRTRLVYVINEHLRCLRLYIDDVDEYASTILRERFRAESIEDLSDHPTMRRTPTGMIEQNSPLLRFCMTINARLQSLRKKTGHTIHQMKTLAEVHCDCSACFQPQAPALVPVPDGESSDPY